MQQTLLISGMLAGGLGLFLLAVSMITDGLKSAAGDSLRGLLTNWTRSPLRGIFTGLMITAMVQSSSAVTVATIGFVNAGLIGMRRALGIVYGSNIGTTMTGWLVAIVGFEINVDAFALPMVGIGMLMHLTGRENKRAPIGLALAGFGLFFIGIDVLKEAFEGLVTTIDLGSISAQGITGILSFVGIGFLMTVLTQSSSAAIALTLTAASGGVLDIDAAAAMVIGANVGTTSTAAIAVIGATSNARRVASAHIIFNVVTGVVALLVLPLLFWIVTNMRSILGLEANPAVTLAMFHSVFNLLGVLLIYPLNNRLASFLESRFVTQEESESLPRYLDKTVAVSPDLAVSALMLEMQRVAGFARSMALRALDRERGVGKRMAIDFHTVSKLAAAIADFVAMLERGVLGRDISEQLHKILRAEQYFLIGADEAVEIVRKRAGISVLEDVDLRQMVFEFHAEAVKLVQLANPEDAAFAYADCAARLEQMNLDYEAVKSALMQAGSELRVPIPLIIDIVDQNSRIRRMCRQLVRAMGLLDELSRIGDAEWAHDSIPPPIDESDS
jgi:phosphate:Na+ symporter